MNDDLISRRAVLDDFKDIRYTLQMMDDTQTADKMMKGLRRAEISVMEAPSAERRGKWEKRWHSVFREELPCCSVCNNFMINSCIYMSRWKYCPNCGAKMTDTEDVTDGSEWYDYRDKAEADFEARMKSDGRD